MTRLISSPLLPVCFLRSSSPRLAALPCPAVTPNCSDHQVGGDEVEGLDEGG